MAVYTTSDLIDSIVTRGQFPDSTNTKTISSPANLLKLATEELRVKIVPMVMEAGEEFYVKVLDIPVVAGQANYPLSTRTVGVTARSVRLINGLSDVPFSYIDFDDAWVLNNGVTVGYYFENNNIVLYPTPNAAGLTIRTRQFFRPNRLEQVSNCAKVTAVNTATFQVTVDSAPASWGVGTSLDMIAQVVPYACRAIDQAVTAISANIITFAALPSDLAVGDYLALAEYSPLPQIPEEFQPILSQMVVCKVLEATGDRAGLQVAKADLKDNMMGAVKLLTPRDQSHPEKIVGRNWRRVMNWG